jgi:hypothetical protein
MTIPSKFCIYCGKEYFKKPTTARKKWENSKFCSSMCKKAVGGVDRICPTCGKEFHTKQAHVDKGWGIYCSISCSKKGKMPSNYSEMIKKSPIVKGNTLATHLKGKKRPEFSEEWRNNMKVSRRKSDKVRGENHWNWKGGLTESSHAVRTSIEYKEWRMAVFQRDNFTCINCGHKGHDIIADHIKPFYFFPELRLNVDNGRTLCKECDKLLGFHYARDKHLYA